MATYFFRGDWRLTRVVRPGPGEAPIATLSGRARLSPLEDARVGMLQDALQDPPAAEWLLYEETGRLCADGRVLTAQQSYLFGVDALGRTVLRYGDGRPFCRFEPALGDGAGRAAARHLCGRDLYLGRLALGPEGWLWRWRVSGPAKRYLSISRYARPSGGALDRTDPAGQGRSSSDGSKGRG